MDRLAIFQVMRPIILNATSVPECILANQNYPAPSGSYCSIEPKLNPKQRGQADITYNESNIDDTVTIIIKRQMIVDCSVNFYREFASDYASLVNDANKIPVNSDLLFNNGLGWQGTQPANDLTALQSNKQEQRRQVTINLFYEDVTELNYNSIEKVPYEITSWDNNDEVVAKGLIE